MPNIYIPPRAHSYVAMYRERGWNVVDRVEDADLVQFVGGADVDPDLYGEWVHPTTSYNTQTDNQDIATYVKAMELGIPMVGICRGGQFLHVMNGGKMWQHVDGHGVAAGHYAECKLTGKTIIVSSTHHQMMCGDVGEVILTGVNTHHTYKECFPMNADRPLRKEGGVEVEAVWHEKTHCLSFQPHPEMCRKDSECQELFFHYLKHYFNLEVVDE